MRGAGEAAERGGAVWEQERKEWEETEAEEEREMEAGERSAAQCCRCSPDLLSVPPSSSLASFSPCNSYFNGGEGANGSC